MKLNKKMTAMMIALAIITSSAAIALCQENKDAAKITPPPAPAAEAVVPAAPAAPAVAQPEEMSIYGEVQSINDASSSIKVQYYDYDSDEEKSIDIVVDKDTKLENAATLHEIKQGDWVDAIYISKDGKNMSKSVIVEREEEAAGIAPAPAKLNEKVAGGVTE